jgi:hypothetical protein
MPSAILKACRVNHSAGNTASWFCGAQRSWDIMAGPIKDFSDLRKLRTALKVQ